MIHDNEQLSGFLLSLKVVSFLTAYIPVEIKVLHSVISRPITVYKLSLTL
jgi:hypothetical protein